MATVKTTASTDLTNCVWTSSPVLGNITIGSGSSDFWANNTTHSTLQVQGDADFAGDVKIQGHSLAQFMAAVEQRLNMLTPNPRLEAEWDQLRELGKQYRDLEQQLLEKEKMWRTLKR